jgi:hypothetical protein
MAPPLKARGQISVGRVTRSAWAISDRRLIRRVSMVTGVYLVSAAAILLAVVLARHGLRPEPLRILLSYLVIATIAAGLEPGTSKAAALTRGAGMMPPLASIMMISTIKGLAASGVLAVIWKISDPSVPLQILLLAPLITITGFCTTDMRVVLDLKDNHVGAILLKQGSSCAGVVFAAILMLSGLSAFLAILISSCARMAVLIPPLRHRIAAGDILRGVRDLAADKRWLEFGGASALSATSGSMDRLVALRDLPAAMLGSYYVSFEILSRFWLLPFLLVPILFARRVKGEISGGFLRVAWIITAVFGLLFLAVLGAIGLFRPEVVLAVTGRPLDSATFALATAVVISSLGQLRAAELQASGHGRHLMYFLAFGVVSSGLIFGFAANHYGVAGLMWGWLLKTVIEFAGTQLISRKIPISLMKPWAGLTSWAGRSGGRN